MIRMRDHCQPVCVIPRVWLSMFNWVLEPGKPIDISRPAVQPDVFKQGGEEDEEVVLGQGLSHADSPSKTIRHKLILLHQAQASLKLF